MTEPNLLLGHILETQQRQGRALSRVAAECSKKLAELTEEMHLAQMAVEHDLGGLERRLGEVEKRQAEPVRFELGHLARSLTFKVGFMAGGTLAAMKLPDEAAKALFELLKLL